MRIAVVTSSPPRKEGGHVVIARAPTRPLRESGHQAATILTPQNRFGRQASAYLATWLTDLGVSDGQRIDQVISLRYPSYAVRHPKHVCWLNHTMREYYDLWNRFSSSLGTRGRLKEQVRKGLIHGVDRYLLTRNVSRVFVQSRTIQQRLAMWPELKTTVLYPPPPQREYRCESYGDYFFFVSRLTALKRADLMVQAMTSPDLRGLRLVIGGDGEERGALQALIDRHDLSDRVRLIGAVEEPELLGHLARCRAVCFPPIAEDYGFVTVEAFAARKPVITCRDSGGPAELVVDGQSGFVCDPSPQSIAQALRTLADDRPLAERMGAEAYSFVSRLTWPDAVRQLTGI
jgi:glycosyltransferase involved in cell wall biosynthesis